MSDPTITPPSTVRVLHVVEDMDLGGSQRVVADLCNHVRDERIIQSVATVVRTGNFPEQVGPHTALYRVGRSRNHRPGTFEWLRPGIRSIVRLLSDHNIQVVQTHLWAASIIGRIAGGIAGVPVILDTHHNTQTWKNSDDLQMDRWLRGFTTKVVCVSNAVKSFNINEHGYDPMQLEVIPNGVDTHRFAPRPRDLTARQELGISNDTVVVGSVCRLVPQKRVQDFIRAIALVGRISSGLAFVLIGEGPEREELQRLASEVGVARSLIILPFRRNVETAYGLMDIFVHTGSREGFGLSVAEAMACGVPVGGCPARC